MLAGTPALDNDYERCSDPGQWVEMFWWPDRTYRLVKVARLMFGRADAANPDAALEPDRALFGGYIGPKAQAVLDEFANGPGTSNEIAIRLGTSRPSVWRHMQTLCDRGLIAVVGSKNYTDAAGHARPVNVYGLECHEVADELHPAIAHLRDSGEWMTTAELAAWMGVKPGGMDTVIKRYRDYLEAWPQEVRKAGRAYRVTYYKWKVE